MSFFSRDESNLACDRNRVGGGGGWRFLLEVIRETVQLFTLNARRAGIEVAVISELENSMWVGYRGYLGQVVLNPLTNVERHAYTNAPGGVSRLACPRPTMGSI